MLVHDLLTRSARLFPREQAVFDGVRERSYAELEGRSGQLAAGLRAAGIGAGERVAVLAKNRVEYVELYFALTRLGAAILPLSWRLRPPELARLVRDAEAAALVAGPCQAAAMEEVRADCRSVRLWAALDEAPSGWRPYEKLFTDGAEAEGARAGERDAAVLMYTSGTTGNPKGAVLSHRNVTAMALSWLHELGLGPAPDRFLQVTPLFHVGGMLQVVAAAAAGAHLRLLPEFEARAALDVLEREGATHALFVPAMVQWLLNEKDVAERGYPALRQIVYGAAPMPVPVLTQALAVFRCAFLQGYGLTETAGVVTTLRPREHEFEPSGPVPERLASAGRAVIGCEVRVVDERGRELPAGEVGEVVARGDQVFGGYWRDPESTAAAFFGEWFRTGDLARVDGEGYVHLVGRSKDLILVAGENVHPGEVEAVLQGHPAVRDAAVIGIPNEHWGEEVLALVVLADGAAASDRELIQHCRAQLARFKCPTRVETRPELPRNAAGKLEKGALREPYWTGRERRI